MNIKEALKNLVQRIPPAAALAPPSIFSVPLYMYLKKVGLFKYIRKIFFNPKQPNKNL